MPDLNYYCNERANLRNKLSYFRQEYNNNSERINRIDYVINNLDSIIDDQKFEKKKLTKDALTSAICGEWIGNEYSWYKEQVSCDLKVTFDSYISNLKEIINEIKSERRNLISANYGITLNIASTNTQLTIIQSKINSFYR